MFFSVSPMKGSFDLRGLRTTPFFIRNAFFQLSLSVAQLFHESSFKGCSGVA